MSSEMKPGGAYRDGTTADGQQGLLGSIAANPAVLDNHHRTPPHGEKVKLGPDHEPYNPNVEFMDTSTSEMREHSLAEDVAADKPIPDDQLGTPYHTTDKRGAHPVPGALEGGGHAL